MILRNPRSNANAQCRCVRAGCWRNIAMMAIIVIQSLSGAGSATLTGLVVDDSGKPVAGAHVSISHAPIAAMPRFAAPPVLTGPLAATVVADASGVFHAEGLAPDQYIACAQSAGPGFLDPCHWAPSAPTFTMSAGLATTGVKVVMPKGHVLRVHVDDPKQLLKPVAGPVDLDFEIHVVTSKGLHHGMPIASSTKTARDHAITIPFDTPVSLRVFAAHFVVNDQSGKPVVAAGATVNVPSGTAPPVVGFTVTGKK